MDRDSFAVAGLSAENFRATFRGQPVHIRSAKEASHPTRIVILLDASGSMRGLNDPTYAKWKLASGIAAHLVNTVPPQIRVALIIFNDRAYVTDFSSGRGEILKQLASMQAEATIKKLVYGSTALQAAIVQATRLLGAPEPGDAILAITDGSDNASEIGSGDVATLLVSRAIRLFAVLFPDGMKPISVGPRGPRSKLARQFTGLVTATGGQFLVAPPRKDRQKLLFQLSPEGEQELKEELQRLYDAMTKAYEIEIELSEEVDKPREWKLELVPKPGLDPKDYRTLYPETLLPCAQP